MQRTAGPYIRVKIHRLGDLAGASALPLAADELVQRRERSKSAKSTKGVAVDYAHLSDDWVSGESAGGSKGKQAEYGQGAGEHEASPHTRVRTEKLINARRQTAKEEGGLSTGRSEKPPDAEVHKRPIHGPLSSSIAGVPIVRVLERSPYRGVTGEPDRATPAAATGQPSPR